jgi:hypothetical protein
MQNPAQVAALAKVDQALAAIGPKLDQHVAAVAEATGNVGYEAAVAGYFRVLFEQGDAGVNAALAAAAVGRARRPGKRKDSPE